MKKISFSIILLSALIIIGGCSLLAPSEIELDMNEEIAGGGSEGIKSEDNESETGSNIADESKEESDNEIKSEDNKIEENVEVGSVSLEQKNSLEIDLSQILTDPTLERTNFESDSYLSIGDRIVIKDKDDKETIWEVTFKSYEVFDDQDDSNRKALVLNFEQSSINLKNADNLTEANPLQPTVFYGDINLREQSYIELSNFLTDGGNYADSGYVLYQPAGLVEGVCSRTNFNEGQTKSCYTYYNYVGPGDYLISFNDGKGNLFNYLLKVE